jgi:hypothetical protein
VGLLEPDCWLQLLGMQYSGAAAGIGDTSLQAVGSLGPACWHGSPEAREAAAGMEEPSLQAAGVLGPALQVWALGGQYSSTASMGNPSLQVAGTLGCTCRCRVPGAIAAAAGMGEPSLWATGVLGPDYLHRLLGVQYSGATACTGNQAYWLAPSVIHGVVGAMVPAYTGHLFPWHFRVKVSGSVVGGGAWSS